MRRRAAILVLLILCCPFETAFAVPSVSAGHWFMNQGTVGNPIQILVAGGDAVEGLNLFLAVGDEISPGQPIIATVDIVGPGTIFNANNTGQFNPAFPPPGLVTISTTTTISDTVPAGGVLANVTIDVPGTVPLGVYPLGLEFVNTFPHLSTDFAGLPAVLIPGTITVTPEPGSIVLALLAAGALLAMAIRRRRI